MTPHATTSAASAPNAEPAQLRPGRDRVPDDDRFARLTRRQVDEVLSEGSEPNVLGNGALNAEAHEVSRTDPDALPTTGPGRPVPVEAEFVTAELEREPDAEPMARDGETGLPKPSVDRPTDVSLAKPLLIDVEPAEVVAPPPALAANGIDAEQSVEAGDTGVAAASLSGLRPVAVGMDAPADSLADAPLAVLRSATDVPRGRTVDPLAAAAAENPPTLREATRRDAPPVAKLPAPDRIGTDGPGRVPLPIVAARPNSSGGVAEQTAGASDPEPGVPLRERASSWSEGRDPLDRKGIANALEQMPARAPALGLRSDIARHAFALRMSTAAPVPAPPAEASPTSGDVTTHSLPTQASEAPRPGGPAAARPMTPEAIARFVPMLPPGNGAPERVVLQLAPQRLGRVEVEIVRLGAAVAIDMRVEAPEALRVLEMQRDTMETALRARPDVENGALSLSLSAREDRQRTEEHVDREIADASETNDPADETAPSQQPRADVI